MKKNLILIGKAEEIDLVMPEVRKMLETEGLYIGSDPAHPEKGEVPFVSMGGKIYSMKIDNQMDPERFIPGTKFEGPFRATHP